MSRVADLLVRLFVMLLGYCAATLAASVFLHFIAWPAIGPEFGQRPWELTGGLLFSIPLIGLFIATAAFFPALVVLAAAEYFRMRSWLLNALAGAAAALGAYAILWSGMEVFHGIDFGAGPDERPLMMDPGLVLSGIAAGMVGGLAYWLVAGRGAGRWLDDRSDAVA